MTTALAPVISIRRAPRSEPPAQTEPRPRHLRLVPDPPQLPLELPRPAHHGSDAPSDGSRASVFPAIDIFASSYARAVSEVLTGHRSPELLAKHTTLGTLNWIRSLAPAVPARRDRTTPRPVVLQVHVCEVRNALCEVTALVQRGPRIRAMTLQFVGMDRRWQCSHLQVV